MGTIRNNLIYTGAGLVLLGAISGCMSAEDSEQARFAPSGDDASYDLFDTETAEAATAPKLARRLAPAHAHTAGLAALPQDGMPPAAMPEDGADRDYLPGQPNSEAYTDHGTRPFVETSRDRLSTFSIDVDTGSYTIARRKLNEGRLPPAAAVRVEEFVNYFRQDYASPTDGTFAIRSDAAASPFRAGKTILRVGLQGRRVADAERKPANLVFLVDVSGSMHSRDKLGLVKQSLVLLTRSLGPNDRVSLCTYAGRVALILPPTPASKQLRILAALRSLEAGGSTGMASGIDMAYELAARQARPGTNTRVIVCSDGDANVGPRTHGEILKLIASRRKQGIFLNTVGFGMGNYKDTMMEQLADQGDGIYSYVDTLSEARRLFCEELTSSIETIARDVKLQVVFNPERVTRYRLIGYENRAIRDRDFRNDAVDAGEIGAGHTVTALYELELAPGSEGPIGEVNLRFKGSERNGWADAASEETYSLTAAVSPSFAEGSKSLRFIACVAEFAEILRQSRHSATDLETLADWLEGARSLTDERELEFRNLVRRAATLVALRGA